MTLTKLSGEPLRREDVRVLGQLVDRVNARGGDVERLAFVHFDEAVIGPVRVSECALIWRFGERRRQPDASPAGGLENLDLGHDLEFSPSVAIVCLTPAVRAREDRQPRCGQAALTEKLAAMHSTILAR